MFCIISVKKLFNTVILISTLEKCVLINGLINPACLKLSCYDHDYAINIYRVLVYYAKCKNVVKYKSKAIKNF